MTVGKKAGLALFRSFRSSSSLETEDIFRDSGLNISITPKKITICLPVTAFETLYYKLTKDGIQLSTDLRLLVTKGENIDFTGIASLIIFGAVVPPLSPFADIKTFIPGFNYEIDTKTFKTSATLNTTWSAPKEDDFHMNLDQQGEVIAQKLKTEIEKACPGKNPIVLFSGGVDSTVLAMITAEMGWKNAFYVHYSFGQQDFETSISQKIAGQLNIPLQIISSDLDLGFQCLQRAAEIYPEPFANHGAVQSFAFAQIIMSKFDSGHTIIDGTGADGIFGLFRDVKKSMYFYRVPYLVRKWAGNLYNYLNLWKDSSKLEYYLRLSRRSSFLTSLPNFIAQNALMEIGYSIPSHALTKLCSYFSEWINSVSRSREDLETIPLLDTIFFNMKRSVPKFLPLFIQQDFNISYPFLSNEVIDLGLNHTRIWPESLHPKKSLKHLLTRKISSNLIYRQKQGFLGPLVEKFSHPVFIKHLDQALDPGSIFSHILSHGTVYKMREYLISQQNLSIQTYNFLWAVTFVHRWLTQLMENHETIKKRVFPG